MSEFLCVRRSETFPRRRRRPLYGRGGAVGKSVVMMTCPQLAVPIKSREVRQTREGQQSDPVPMRVHRIWIRRHDGGVQFLRDYVGYPVPILGSSSHHPVTRNTTAIPESPAAQPPNNATPPPRNTSSSISSITLRRPVGPCGCPQTSEQP